MLYFAASIVTGVDVEKRAADLDDLEDKVKAESEQIYVDRDEQLAALEDRLQRRRDYLAAGKERNFDEDDDFWARGLSNWAEEQACRRSRKVRELGGGIFVELARTITTEDAKKIRELVRQTATRDDRGSRRARSRRSRPRRAADPRGARPAPRRDRQGVRLEEGRAHEAPPQDRDRCSSRA